MQQRGRLQPDAVARIARLAWLRATQPTTNPITFADDLGFELLPCVPWSHPETTRTTATCLVFAAVGDRDEHARRVRRALARGLLLREGITHNADDVEHLADELAYPPPPHPENVLR